MGRPVPTLPAERIVTLDILRGFALLGILVVNMASFGGTVFDEATVFYDQVAEFVGDVLFSGKFNSLFSLLFAIGFTIQLGRLGRGGSGGSLWIYLRRLLVLFTIGIAHAILVWDGDVLHVYAILGFVLLLVRNLSDRAVLVLIALLLLAPAARSLALVLFASPEGTANRVADQDAFRTTMAAALGSGSYLDAVAQNVRTLEREYVTTLFGFVATLVLWYSVLLVTMLVGLLAGRHRWIQRAAERPGLVRRVQWWALAVGIGTGIVLAVATRFTEPSVPSLWAVAMRTAYSLSRVALMIFYVATIVRLALNPRWLPRLMPLAAAGRMPLTNYLMQSVLCTFIFYGWGLGFWDRAGAALQLALALGIFFLIQVPFSVLWFRRFAYGPLEHLWRILSYGHRPGAAPTPQPTA